MGGGMSGSFYVVTYKGVHDDHVRVMGFQSDLASAMRLTEIFGEGAEFEEIQGTFPQDERVAAFRYEEHRRRHGMRLVGGV